MEKKLDELLDQIRSAKRENSPLIAKAAIPQEVKRYPASYDNSKVHVTETTIDKMLKDAFPIRVHATYVNDDGEERESTGAGAGFSAFHKDGKQYFLTCNHVIDMPPTLYDWASGQTYQLRSSRPCVEVGEEEIEIDVIRTNADLDIAVLRCNKISGSRALLAGLPLRPGDIAYAVGNPLNIGEFISDGIITHIPEDEDVVFYTSSALNPGNSGGPLYVLKQGAPYVAGIGQFYIRDTQGMFGSIHCKHLRNELKAALD